MVVFRFVCRLYLYPKKVLYSAGHIAVNYIPEGSRYMYFFFNTMLWLLFFMNVWWFHFIVWLIIRVARGDSREVEDVRELPDDQQPPLKQMANGHTHKNGLPGKVKGGEPYIPISVVSHIFAIVRTRKGICISQRMMAHAVPLNISGASHICRVLISNSSGISEAEIIILFLVPA